MRLIIRAIPVLTMALSLLWLYWGIADGVVQAHTLKSYESAAHSHRLVSHSESVLLSNDPEWSYSESQLQYFHSCDRRRAGETILFTSASSAHSVNSFLQSESVSSWNDPEWGYSESRPQYFESYDCPPAVQKVFISESSTYGAGSTFVFYDGLTVTSPLSYVVNFYSESNLTPGALFASFTSTYLAPPILLAYSGMLASEMNSFIFDQSHLRVLQDFFSIETSPLTNIKTLAKSRFRFVDTVCGPSLKTSIFGRSTFDCGDAMSFTARPRRLEADLKGCSTGTFGITQIGSFN